MSLLHLHLMLNHVPMIGLGFVAIILAVALWRNSSEMTRLGLVLVVGLAAVAGLVFLTGEPAEEAVENLAGVAERAIHDHEEAAEAALVAVSLVGVMCLLALARFLRRPLPRWTAGAALALVLVAGGVMGWAANLGGQIRHTEISGSMGSAGSDSEREGREGH